MNPLEKRAAFILALISGLRMFGFFMLLPIFKELAQNIVLSTPALIGFAMGIYGLVQSFLYLPLGVASDRLGRKPIIITGLLFLIVGAMIAARADNIYVLIAARALQGVGAISAVLSAFMADLVRNEHRTKAMALVGIMVGVSFPLSLMVAPSLYQQLGQGGLFYLIAILAACALLLVLTLPRVAGNASYTLVDLRLALAQSFLNPQLNVWMISVVFLHALSMMFFYAAPNLLKQYLNLQLAQQWWIYLPILMVSFFLAMYLVKAKYAIQRAANIALACLFFGYILLMIALSSLHGTPAIYLITTGYLSYFIGFNYLEIMQPSIISQHAPTHLKGSIMGIYYSLQSFGMFLGALMAGGIERLSLTKMMPTSQGLATDTTAFATGIFKGIELNYFVLIFTISAGLVIIWHMINVILRKQHGS